MTPLWPYCGTTLAYCGPTVALLTEMSDNMSDFHEFLEKWSKCLKTKGIVGPDPYHGALLGSVPSPVPHYPGYTHPVHHHPGTTMYDEGCGQTANHGSPGFIWLQWPSQNTDLSKTTTFIEPKSTCQNWPFSEN